MNLLSHVLSCHVTNTFPLYLPEKDAVTASKAFHRLHIDSASVYGFLLSTRVGKQYLYSIARGSV